MPLTERDTNIPPKAQTRSSPSHKTPQLHSKLPRFVATPNSAPAATKWTSRVAEPVASVERTARTLRYTPTYKREPTAIQTVQKVNKLGLLAKDKPLPHEKALPSRPLARLSTDPSPSKDGRCLIDASEQPLLIASVSGDKHEWPILRPATPPSERSMPLQNPDHKASLDSVSGKIEMEASMEFGEATTGKDTGTHRDSKRISYSPTSSFISAKESKSQMTASYTSCRDQYENVASRLSIQSQPRRTLSNASSHSELPTRKASLPNRISNGSLVTPTTGSRYQVTTMTDFTRTGAASPCSTGSRTHSPSPTSFSRPRPGSIASTAATPRSMKTASRIPIPDSKKATIIDVKKDLPPTPTGPRTSGIPTFGSRRLASPDALKILENGKLRRQVQRTPQIQNASNSTQIRIVDHANDAEEMHPSSSSYSGTDTSDVDRTTTPEAHSILKFSCNSDDEVPTPSDMSSHFHGNVYRTWKPTLRLATSQTDAEQSLFASDAFRTATRPPQTSPFVAPLETIPSEAMLTVDVNDFNQKTREDLIKTLSHLEGKGSPPKYDVDNETLIHMFGHLKKGLERKPHNSTVLVQNAAAAEKFLDMRGSSILEVKGLESNIRNSRENDVGDSSDAIRRTAAEKKQTVISKWSASTPSDKALSPPSDDADTSLHPPSIPKTRPKSSSPQDLVSIGYPSRIPSKIVSTNLPTVEDAATIASIPSHRSSPTLSKRKPGSVRAARANLQISNSSFMRTTASAESRKIAKSPNGINRAFSVADTTRRGRMTVMEKSGSRSDGQSASQTPRSHSKSRYVLDKINGLFSGKRDKKSIAIPPVPRIEENSAAIEPRHTSDGGSPPVLPRPVQTAQLSKMPSPSPTAQAFPRSTSRTTMRTDDTTLVDRISMREESQCVQVLSEHLVGKARREVNPQRKERLLTFAKVLNDSLISVREAAISAETAQHAAKSAQVSYEMTQKSLAMVQRLATVMARTGNYGRN